MQLCFYNNILINLKYYKIDDYGSDDKYNLEHKPNFKTY